MVRIGAKVVALGAVLVLAGCLGGQDAPSGIDGFDADGLGGVEGSVITQNLDPVIGAEVRLSQGGSEVASTMTGEEGIYAFSLVEPGTYRLEIEAMCCDNHVQAVDIVADKTATVDVMLPVLTSYELRHPFIEQLEWNGFIACGLVILALCSALDDPNDDFNHRFPVKEGLKSVVITVDWDSSPVNIPGDLRIIFDNWGETSGGVYQYEEVIASPPVDIRIDAGQVGGEYDPINLEDEWWLRLRVWSGGVTYQQAFTAHIHLAYFEHAPANYSPLPDQ